jgi:DDE_Tnp_1-associated
MPAASSSLTGPAIGQLLTAAQALGAERARLLAVLAAVPDPRARRGVRHQLAVILSLALCAVLAGARSFTAIAEWAADADQATRDALGVTGVVPCESTFRQTLQNLDADALDDAAGAWAQQRTAPAAGTRRMIAVDGKTLRGSGVAGGPGRHLLSALDHAHGVVLGQVDVEAKRTRSRCSPPCWTASAWPARWSPQTLCTPSAATRITWSPSAARIT